MNQIGVALGSHLDFNSLLEVCLGFRHFTNQKISLDLLYGDISASTVLPVGHSTLRVVWYGVMYIWRNILKMLFLGIEAYNVVYLFN